MVDTKRLVELFYLPVIAKVLECFSPKELIFFDASLAETQFIPIWLKCSANYYPCCCKRVTLDFGNLKLKKAACLTDHWIFDKKILITNCTIVNFKYSTLKLGSDVLSSFTNLTKLVIVKSLMPHSCQCLVNFVARCIDFNLLELVFVEVAGLEGFFRAMSTRKRKVTSTLTSLSFYHCHHSLIGVELAKFLLTSECLKTLLIVIDGSSCSCSFGTSGRTKDIFNVVILDVIAQNIHLKNIGMNSFLLQKCNLDAVKEALITRNGFVEEIDDHILYDF